MSQWLALLDAAIWLLQSANAEDRLALDRVSRALDVLSAHEHSMTADERLLAREITWRRDRDELFPVDHAWWARCQCRACLLERRTRPVVRPQLQLNQLPIQGDLFP